MVEKITSHLHIRQLIQKQKQKWSLCSDMEKMFSSRGKKKRIEEEREVEPATRISVVGFLYG